MMNKENYVIGNAVLAPNYEPAGPSKKQEYERLKKTKAENLYKKREKRVNSKAKTLRCIALVFIVGVTLIFRYTSIYNVQKNLSNIKSETISLNKENENLKVELVKSSNLSNVEKIATGKLNMVRVEKHQVIYTDLTKENFAKDASLNKNHSQSSFLQKVYKMLF